ncbi:MFS transporter [Streptomyces sp. NBC_01808]|uniref:MFS transporter n=1 Tax=Streptomyces sp. NBC_01808 TaxID=2975947 RepID=UPI002DD93FD2|nr:MFS transporter [Streptomyces sp. NBC_01808]WSA38869.1 MFS transporter [Streptomyces sp. NBC_01808]
MAACFYAYSFLDDFVLLYPVYALLFADHGLSLWQISSLFVIWSLTSLLLEVPSGAWADAFSRRLLLCAGPLLTGVGFTLWILAPSYWAFAAGFVLWGAKGAFASGALEALVYEELGRAGAADRYARTLGRGRAAGTVGVMASMAAAAPVFAAGGYAAVGAASVASCLLGAAVATRFPEHRAAAAGAETVRARGQGPAGGEAAPDGEPPSGGNAGGSGSARRGDGQGASSGVDAGPPADADAGPDSGDPELGWVGTLRAGLAELRAEPSVRGALLLVPAVVAVWGSLDEYTPYLVREAGVADPAVPLYLLLIWAGAAAGGLLAGRVEERGRAARTPAGVLAALLAGSAVALAAGGLLGTAVGIALVGVAFGGFQVATVLAEARLQERITGPARATLTSLAGVGTDLGTIAVYGAYGLLGSAAGLGHGAAFAVCALPYLVVAPLLLRGRGRKRA